MKGFLAWSVELEKEALKLSRGLEDSKRELDKVHADLRSFGIATFSDGSFSNR